MPQPVIGVVQGFCSPAAAPVLQACDIAFASHDARFGNPSIDAVQAERDGLVTLTFPLSELDAETAALARELAAKDPLALRFTKETLGLVGTMGWDEVLAYNAAKAAELKSLQAGRPSARAVAVESFLSGKSKPGLGR
jgi:trans-feruloyl-CoA hydratase/vanillin synthase